MYEVIEGLYRAGVVRIGEFVLTSGLRSPYYIDLRRVYSHPDLVDKILERLLEVVDMSDIEALVGVATAGIPLAAYMACRKRIPMGYVRIEKREHGTASVVEGEVSGKRVAVVDDVATTGGSIERAVYALREHGARPVAAIVVVDREQGARERVEGLGLRFYRLVTSREIFSVLYERGLIDRETFEKIIRYIEGERAQRPRE